jgi:hypothetical protein
MAQFVIDSGHGGSCACGGSTPIGAVGSTGVREKDVTLGIGRRVAEMLGPDAILTRSGDTNLSFADRTRIARDRDAPVLISIHANSAPHGWRGSEVWVHSRAAEASRRLAGVLDRELARIGNSRGLQSGDLAVLAPDWLPQRAAAALIEVDNLTDPRGESRLRDPRELDSIAHAIAQGLRSYRYGWDTSEMHHDLAEQYRRDRGWAPGEGPSDGQIVYSDDYARWLQERSGQQAPGNVDLRIPPGMSFPEVIMDSLHVTCTGGMVYRAFNVPGSGSTTLRLRGTGEPSNCGHSVRLHVKMIHQSTGGELTERTHGPHPAIDLPNGVRTSFELNYGANRGQDYRVEFSLGACSSGCRVDIGFNVAAV